MLRIAWFVAFGVVAAGCSGGDDRSPVTVHASVGTYEDGSGGLGVAALAAIRDDAGESPDRAFKLRSSACRRAMSPVADALAFTVAK